MREFPEHGLSKLKPEKSGKLGQSCSTYSLLIRSLHSCLLDADPEEREGKCGPGKNS